MSDRSNSNRETFAIPVRQSVRLALAENPTTSYTWVVVQPCPLLSLQSQQFVPGTVGVGVLGQRTWKFSAATEGSCSLQLQLRHSWQSTSDQPLLCFHITVTA